MKAGVMLYILSSLLLACLIISCETKVTPNQRLSEQPSIVIIGAGIAGLAAADKLINEYKFKNVTILEALNRVGGRIHPVPFGDGDGYLQLGAEWLHHRQNPVFEMALQLGLITNAEAEADEFVEDMDYVDQNACKPPERLRSDYNRFAENSFKKLEQFDAGDNYKWSYGAAMEDLYRKFLNQKRYNASDVRLLDAMLQSSRAAIEQYYAAEDWNLISINDTGDAEEATENGNDEGPITISMTNQGYKAILNEMTRRVPSSKYIHFNSRVQRIKWNIQNGTNFSKPVQIELMGGRRILADHAIVTCPLGHLKHYAHSLFNPPLPKRKLDTIKSLGFGAVDKLFLSFDKPYWSNDTFDMNLIRVNASSKLPECSRTAPLKETTLTRMIQVISTSQAPPTVMAWIGGRDPPAFENATDKDVAEAAVTVLRKFLNSPSIPTPRITRSAWYSNPLFHGSYSYNSIECYKINCRRETLSEPLGVTSDGKAPLLLFAGEATNPVHYSTVHGAFATGVREADRIATIYHI